MPELPEVENVRLQLEKYLVGHTIEKVDIRTPNIFEGDEKKIESAKVVSVRRFGKALVIDLDNDYSLVSHIKLTGQYIYRGPNLTNPKKLSKKVTGGLGGKHTHVIFHLSSKGRSGAGRDQDGTLYYNEVRKFGWIKIVNSSELTVQSKFIANLGPEFLKDLKLSDFKKICGKTRRAIKVLLMDQSKMAGAGNIYANDALWLAKIDPRRPANSLSDSELKELFNAVETVLKKGLETGGASELAFVTPDGTEGSYQDHTLVYGKQGTKCPDCGGKIEKFTLGGRGTYWCKQCQT